MANKQRHQRGYSKSGILFLFAIFLVPTSASAQWVFDDLFDRAWPQAGIFGELPEESIAFMTRTVNAHFPEGQQLTEAQVKEILEGRAQEVCADIPNFDNLIGCSQIEMMIEELAVQEREISAFGDELLAIAHGAELVASDESHRPLALASAATTFSSIWSGTGTTALPWPESDEVEDALEALEQKLAAESADIDQIVMRFHFGLFRADREEEVGTNGLTDYGPETRAALRVLADALDIDTEHADDPDLGEYTTPPIGIGNLALWAREDDIGLHWIYPTHLPRFDIRLPSTGYLILPAFSSGALSALSYPYRFEGTEPAVPTGVKSPLCTRAAGRFGYLCRPVGGSTTLCPPSGGDTSAVSLVTCDEKEELRPIPVVCDDPTFTDMFTLEHPDTGEGGFGPSRVCVPRTKTEYMSSIVAHACYIGYCLRESFTGHTLLGNRNPIAIAEPLSPYQACMRDDPRVGLLTELPASSAILLPQYRGPSLVRDLERRYCELGGQVPREGGLTGLCQYQPSRRSELPLQLQAAQTVAQQREEAILKNAQKQYLAAAAAMGQHAALDQSIDAYRAIGDSIALTIRAMTRLFEELSDEAPVTTFACPLSGPLPPEYCALTASPPLPIGP